ncbi:MAG: hydrogenase expression/formation protein HypE [Desulfuromonadales bacterium]|nr:hydrogenase expression/formation protein HypE [Desulfuromonadales bacterium]MBN2791855.1 hydrogenase expression/formation protein HypE [Desulfuromonadales bacterium]
MSRIQLAQGSGGRENQQLIRDLFLKYFSNPILAQLDDAAVVECGTTAVSTDTFTVHPLEFAGGDIGKLAIAGTTNDVAMRAACPEYLSVGFIIEEGLETELLERIVASMSSELQVTGARIITGDTKVVPRGAVDRLMINTTGFGAVRADCSVKRIVPGDHILISGPIAEHGACIYAAREEIAIAGLTSDCQSLWPAVKALLDHEVPIHAMRDATRGGLAAVLNEWAEQSSTRLMMTEEVIPISEAVRGFTEILGIDPYILACEGAFLLSLPAENSSEAIDILHRCGHPDAVLIGQVENADNGPQVILTSAYGTQRLLDFPYGEILPRIC